MRFTRYDKGTQTHTTLSLERKGWRIQVRRASVLIKDRLVNGATAYNCTTFYGFTQVSDAMEG